MSCLGAFVLCLLSVVLLSGAARAAAPTNLSPATTAANPVALLNADQKAYLYTMTFDQRRKAAKAAESAWNSDGALLFCYGSPVSLSWRGTTGECTVEVRKVVSVPVAEAATVREGTVVWTGTTDGTSVTIYNLELGAEYEWTVTCGGESASATFTTDATPPRLIKTGLVRNLRDLGGWTGTLGGKQYKVRQNLIFRGGAVDNPKWEKQGTPAYLIADDSERDFFYNVVGLKNEVDLRDINNTAGDNPDLTAEAKRTGEYKFDLTVTGEHVTYNNFSIANNDIPKSGNIVKVWQLMLTPEKLPAYFHCKSGRDRTGIVAAVLLAVLGVSRDDIVRDFQTTSDKDNWETYGFGTILDTKLANYKKGAMSLAENAEAYLKDCGLTGEQIETFRKTMLVGYGEPEDPEDPEEPEEPSGGAEVVTNFTMSVGQELTFDYRFRKNLRYWLLGSTNKTHAVTAGLSVPTADCADFAGYQSRSTTKTNEVTVTLKATDTGVETIFLGRQYKLKTPKAAVRYKVTVK